MRHVMTALVAAALGMTAAPALAADPPPGAAVVLTVAPPPPTYAGQAAVLSFVLTADGAPLAGEPVSVDRQQAGAWVPVTTATTGPDGRAGAPVVVAKAPADNAVRLTYRDDAGTTVLAQQTLTLPLRQRASRLMVSGPGAVVDERTSPVTVTWRADDGEGVAGPVTLQYADRHVVKRRRKKVVQWRWHTAAVVTTAADGVATYPTRPRTDTRWRAFAGPLPWVTGAASGVYALDNRPPGAPVRLPRRAPEPRRKLPLQPHAVGAGANPVVGAIPDGVWRSMVGRTWHAGCPVGRSGLSLVQVNYWDYTGYRRRGQLVVATGVAGQVAAAFADLYAHRIPIRSMLVRPAARGQRLPVDGGGQHVRLQLPGRGRQPARPVAALARHGDRRQHLGEPLPLRAGDGAQSLVAVALPPAGGLAQQPPRRRTHHGEPRPALDLRARRHPALRRRPGGRRPAGAGRLRPAGMRVTAFPDGVGPGATVAP